MTNILTGLMTGLPLLLLHFAVTVALLLVGIVLHMLLTPMKEKELIAAGNNAAALSLAAATLGLALPLAATLATSQAIADIVIWGGVGTLVQVLIFIVARFIAPNLPCRIERGDMAAAITLAGWQLSIGLLNAAALAG